MFCADNVFEEIQNQTSYDQRYLPCFMHRFLEFYTINHPRTITFYFEFMESFQIPKHKLELETLPQVNSTTLVKLARNLSRMFEFRQNLNIGYCFICGKELIYKCLLKNENHIEYDRTKLTIFPCCANLTCVTCAKPNTYYKHNNLNCRRCKSNLHGGQSAQSLRDITLKSRVKIRRLHGFHIKHILPPLDL